MENLWIAEYNFSQDCFHTDLLHRSLKVNTQCVENKIPNAWIPIAIGTYEECNNKIKEIKKFWKK